MNTRRNIHVPWHVYLLSDALSSGSRRHGMAGWALGALIIGRKESVSKDRFALYGAGLPACKGAAVG